MQRFSSALYLEQILTRPAIDSEESRHSILSFGSEGPGDGEITDAPVVSSLPLPPLVVVKSIETDCDAQELNVPFETNPQKTEIPKEQDAISHKSADSDEQPKETLLNDAAVIESSPRGTTEPSLLSDDENDDDEDNVVVELPLAPPPVPPKDRQSRLDVRIKRQSYHPQQQEFRIEDQDDVFYRKPGFLSNHRHTVVLPHSASLSSVPNSISSMPHVPPLPPMPGTAPSFRSGLRRETSKLTLKRKTLTNKLKRAFSMNKLNKRI